jgi:hypothetical protein
MDRYLSFHLSQGQHRRPGSGLVRHLGFRGRVVDLPEGLANQTTKLYDQRIVTGVGIQSQGIAQTPELYVLLCAPRLNVAAQFPDRRDLFPTTSDLSRFVHSKQTSQEETGKRVVQYSTALASDRDRLDEAIAMSDVDVEGSEHAGVSFDTHAVEHQNETWQPATDTRRGLDELCGRERHS